MECHQRKDEKKPNREVTYKMEPMQFADTGFRNVKEEVGIGIAHVIGLRI